MKQITLLSIFILAFSSLSFAQVQRVVCPAIKITAPESRIKYDEPLFFSVEINEEFKKLNLEYKWEVTSGIIEYGQGTFKIKVLPKNDVIEVTAIVKIKGLPEDCLNIVSEFAYITPRIKDYLQPDEYGKTSLKDEFARLDQLIVRVANAPGYQGFIEISIGKNESVAKTKNHIRKLIKYIEYRSFSKKQFVFAIRKTSFHKTALHLFPEGSNFSDCEDCIILKGEDL
jgi:hypothetical protein